MGKQMSTNDSMIYKIEYYIFNFGLKRAYTTPVVVCYDDCYDGLLWSRQIVIVQVKIYIFLLYIAIICIFINFLVCIIVYATRLVMYQRNMSGLCTH